jgi:hypothetical protein
MFTKSQLRAQGFHIFPVGHKVCFQDRRNGYVSPSYDADTCMEKLMEYIGLHRAEVITLRSEVTV